VPSKSKRRSGEIPDKIGRGLSCEKGFFGSLKSGCGLDRRDAGADFRAELVFAAAARLLCGWAVDFRRSAGRFEAELGMIVFVGE
jgi:hypothetical protein